MKIAKTASHDDENPRLPPCPICGKPPVEAYQPFCSKRCANVDLHRWLSGGYAIPATPDEEERVDLPEEGEE